MTPPQSRNDGKTLPVGYKLHNYRILGVLGAGGFGITYLAEDEMLHQKVAIKEYFPASLATRDATTAQLHTSGGEAGKYFKWGLDRFISEARIMARIDHPNIVRVFNFATLNETGYMVMPYETGEPLDKWVRQFEGHKIPPEKVVELLEPITRALGVIHGLSLIHRDVKPANIFIRQSGSPVLLDFGAARSTVGAASQTVAAIVSTGYSPIEQYSDVSEQGPWTDIYATAAVAYKLITGKIPPDAASRISAQAAGEPDKCETLTELKPAGFSRAFLAAIDRGLQVNPQMRPQSIEAWRKQLGFPAITDVREGTVESAPTVLSDPRPAQPSSRLQELLADPRRTAAAVVGAGMILGGLYLAVAQPWRTSPPVQTSEARKQVGAKVAGKEEASNSKTSEPADTSNRSASDSEGQKAEPQRQARLDTPAPSSPAPPAPAPQSGPSQRQQGLEQILSGSLLWTVLRMEFPDWYQMRLQEAAADTDLKPERSKITKHFLPDLKALRLEESANALQAPSEFKQIAAVYSWNLQLLSEHSAAACHDGIMRGEDTIFLSLLLDHEGAPYETLMGMIFRAASVGRKVPNDVGKPRATDYDQLKKVLRSFGWKQSDFNTFSDSNQFAKASPEKACQLVTEWYRAHLALDDKPVQSRLLKESLTPLIAE